MVLEANGKLEPRQSQLDMLDQEVDTLLLVRECDGCMHDLLC